MNICSARPNAIAFAILLVACPGALTQTSASNDTNRTVIRIPPAKTGGKELLIPVRISRVPATNDFNSPDSEFTNHLDKSGWRHGFVAHKDDGFSKSNSSVEFTVPAHTKYLWLVVMGAPTEHWIRTGGRGGRRGATAAAPSADEQWPYKFKLTGTAADDSIIH